ncbi:MAG TPA: hypothetical protein PK735_05160 [Flavobacteriales bacterium]|nr:hypothetical protein [Flavobacteriales bacterium]
MEVSQRTCTGPQTNRCKIITALGQLLILHTNTYRMVTYIRTSERCKSDLITLALAEFRPIRIINESDIVPETI